MRTKLLILLFAFVLGISFPMSAKQKKGKNVKDSGEMQIPLSQRPASDLNKFVIEGFVAIDIPDSCYNIYITDLDSQITQRNLVACVPVVNKRFRFETDIDSMKKGRIRAIFPGNHLCDAWVDIYFMPGFTVYMTINNGYYDIHNQNEYNFMVSAWINREPLTSLIDLTADNKKTTQGGVVVVETDTYKLKAALDAYRNLSNDITVQMKQSGLSYDQKLIFIKRLESINQKMEQLIERYASSIK